MYEPEIGERVRATMNGVDWYKGTFVERSEVFVAYGVLRDDINEVRYFNHVETLQEDEK